MWGWMFGMARPGRPTLANVGQQKLTNVSVLVGVLVRTPEARGNGGEPYPDSGGFLAVLRGFSEKAASLYGLGKLMLYQLSYARVELNLPAPRPESKRIRGRLAARKDAGDRPPQTDPPPFPPGWSGTDPTYWIV